METIENFYENLGKLHEGEFYGQLRRGIQPTGVEIYFHKLKEGIELRDIELEGVPPQLWVGPTYVKKPHPETGEWIEIEAPVLKAFLLLDPRVYKGKLEEVKLPEELLPGMHMLRASYHASSLLSFDGKQLLPNEVIDWLKRWGQDKRQISFVTTPRYELIEMSQSDIPPYFDPENPYNPNFTVTVSLIGHRSL